MIDATKNSDAAGASPSTLRIADLVAGLEARGLRCRTTIPGDVVVTGVHHDSRRISPGDLFLALPGTRDDGARFAGAALEAGAAAVVCSEDAAAKLPSETPVIAFADVERAAGEVAAIVFGSPARKVRLVGVTGTNGKTSCTYILESVLAAAGYVPGVIGTVSQRWPGHESSAAMTTPPARDIHEVLARMHAAGCDAVAMEVSSHALSQHRVAGCEFAAAIFTNLTRDHLDYHGDEEAYFAAKARLFLDYLDDDGVAVLNADDPFAMRLASAPGIARTCTFSLSGDSGADVYPRSLDGDLTGMRAVVRAGTGELSIETRLLGHPNLSNILAVVAAASALGIDAGAIERGIAACAPVPGRLERIGLHAPAVLVDYAHTPDALERTLETVRADVRGRLIVVFGCGGDRDRGKRPMMGEIAGRLADFAVLTSDNPRGEAPAAILADIEEGIAGLRPKRSLAELSQADARGYIVEADRASAIEAAIAAAASDDVVVVAGKGHETYQEVAGVRHDFDDRAIVARILEARARVQA